MSSTKFKALRSKRFRLFVGPTCNAKCRFCYYIDYWQKTTNPSTDFLKKELRWAHSQGGRAVDFSGGEPTVREDLPELIAYAKKIGYKSISIITNALRISDEKYLSKLVDAGLNDVLISIHGPTAEMHEGLVGVPKSFEKLLSALDNVKASGARLRTNTTVTTENYTVLPDFAKLLVPYKPFAVNFILFNNFYSPQSQKNLMPDFDEASKFIKQTIDLSTASIPKITVRYIPFCFMKGYEKYVCDFPQLPYDADEWAPEIQWYSPDFGVFAPHDRIQPRLRVQRLYAKVVLSLGSNFDSKWLFEAQKNYFKPEKCQSCAYRNLCDGLKMGYEKLYPNYQLYPSPENVLDDPMEYRGPYLASSQ